MGLLRPHQRLLALPTPSSTLPMFTRRHFLTGSAAGLALLAMRPYPVAAARTYTNPVLARNFPDPFVLRHGGHYYAFGTTGRGRTPDGRIFMLLTSDNLVDWRPPGGALTPPPGSEEFDFWAPEIVLHEGTFYMYYSRGGGAIGATVGHQLHVATSQRPEGPYTEIAALPVADSPFTIDAHAFRDTDGQWYLFYARDFDG
ncbi:MAG: family 43 glycosylhydrolase [Hymenobacter sp.]